MSGRLAVLAAGLLAGTGAASEAQQRGSLGVAVMVVASDPVFAGGGLAVTVPASGFVRLRAIGVAGRRGGDTVTRWEGLIELVLDSGARAWAPFAGAGAAANFDLRGEAEGRMVVVAGMEQRPSAGRGWRIEGGIGGGGRVAVGYRLAL